MRAERGTLHLWGLVVRPLLLTCLRGLPNQFQRKPKYTVDTSLPSPSIKVFGPTDEEISMDGLVTLVCLATKLSVPFAEVSWTACGVKVTSGVTTSLAAKHNDGTFSISSYLSLPAIKWTSTERKFSCEVKPEGSGSRAVAHLDDARC
ncbi:IGLC6 protein, partial [Polypterus senegalus]